jgi:hypothetical protein
MQSFDVMLGCRVSAERGVPFRDGDTAFRDMSEFASAMFLVVRAPYVLLTYNVGKVLVPLSLVGLHYRVLLCLVGRVGPYGSYRREYPALRESFLLCPPAVYPLCR